MKNNTMKINDIEEDEKQLTAKSNQAELLRWYYKLGYLSFIKVQYLVTMGILPKKLSTEIQEIMTNTP